VAEKHGFQDFYKTPNIFFVVFAEHIDSISSIFFFPHWTQIRGGVQHRKAIPNHIDKKGQSILQLQKYQT